MTDYDVAVCGCGVAGLLVARALELLGLRVVVLDKQRELRPILRGELLQPRCQEILETLGVLAPLLARDAVPVPRLACRNSHGRELVPLDYVLLPGTHHCILSLEYATIQSCLTEAFGPRVDLRRGVLVRGLLHDRSGRVRGVRVTADRREQDVQDITAALVIAADGRTSLLRQAAGIPTVIQPYPHELVAFELATPNSLAPEVTAYVTDRGLRLVYPLPRGRTRLYVQVPRGQFRTVARGGLADWRADLLASTPALAPLAEGLAATRQAPHVLPVWRFSAPAVTQPGLVLVGEAARCMHPMAAQGMTAAALDAALLAELFQAAGALEPAAVDAVLRAFQQRQQQVRDRAALSHKIASVFTNTSWRGRVVSRHLVGQTMRDARRCQRLTRKMAGLEYA